MHEHEYFTIGHSNRDLRTFIDLLEGAGIQLLVDVRTVPRSRSNPQFNRDALPLGLSACGIAYEHVAALGGLRPKSKELPRELNGFWENDSFHNYADYACTDAFRKGLEHLIERGESQRSAIMCSEAVWWRCHRRIVADHLMARGLPVFHIMASNRIEAARMTTGAVAQPDGGVLYPRD
ncbi:MAG TPA: DUF488 domain-containing protein [Castellaniella sp.]|nr:DUF488 domain-containing protein [Castellaniella sp.]